MTDLANLSYLDIADAHDFLNAFEAAHAERARKQERAK